MRLTTKFMEILNRILAGPPLKPKKCPVCDGKGYWLNCDAENEKACERAGTCVKGLKEHMPECSACNGTGKP